MSAYPHQGVVYFAATRDYVKIGYTAADVHRRLAYMFGGRGVKCPAELDRSTPLRLIYEIPGCVIRDERRVQGLFAAHHVEGEWFRHDTAFLNQLGRLEYVTYKEGLMAFRHARAELKRRPSLARAA